MTLHRRDFLRLAALQAGAVACSGRVLADPDGAQGMIMTVRGPIAPDRLGFTLPHEHVFSIFGLDPADPPPYDRPRVITTVLPYLREVRDLGVDAVFDASGIYLGRDVTLLRSLAEASGLHLVTNTSFYGAANDRYVPAHAFADSPEALAARWTREWREGIDGTGIRPGFQKIGVDPGPLSEIDAKLVRAGAMTHRATGLTMAVHTSNSPEGAARQLEILREEGVHPSAWIWVHAHNVEDERALLDAARAGAWISLDGYRADRTEPFVQRIRSLRDAGFLDQVLLSHDANTYPRNGMDPPRAYTALMRELLPALRAAGFGDAEIDRMTRANPARAFTVRVRAT